MTTSVLPSSLRTALSPTPSLSTRPTQDPEPPGFLDNAPENTSDNAEKTKEGVFQYYFLFLALFGVLIGVALWMLHRSRKRRKERYRQHATNALARDLDGWSTTRRWMHGGWRNNRGEPDRGTEEGLNENGEAPPPYEPPKASRVEVNEDGGSMEQEGYGRVGITVPMRTLVREDVGRVRPPDYEGVVASGESGSARLDAVDTHATRPDIAAVQPNSSTNQFA
ncbi:hypothetical protein GQ43DRAFT_476590 [Delitschia confertaspora ATCC 74209]|uniref:Uncharacterized protein n=1 Tax=Delitschia confertaspora ATCC 74209 TaxID=1513339 RepID=A0A9P4JG97_9PLEO|nr:hypothetical protein GQ43DRAFT_476590 [Delitschia confertaspora ATCC 74209]